MSLAWNHSLPSHIIISTIRGSDAAGEDAIIADKASLKSAIKSMNEKEMVLFWGILHHKTSVCGSQMPPLQGSTEVSSAKANQSWWTYASWVFIIGGFISMPVNSCVALITGSLLWEWGPKAMLKDPNPLQDPVIIQHGSAGLFDLHVDQWRDHSGLTTTRYPNVCVHVHSLPVLHSLICFFS